MKDTVAIIIIFVVGVIFFTSLLIFTYSKKDKKQEYKKVNYLEKIYDSRCSAGFRLYQEGIMRICYPEDMEIVSQERNASPSSKIQTVLSSEKEKLIIGKNNPPSLSIHLCTIKEPVLVASRSAKRIVIREETTGGCGAVHRVVTLIPYKKDMYSIDFTLFNSVFYDKNRFEKIEQSFSLDPSS